MTQQSTKDLREFYEQSYERDSGLTPLLDPHDFMYAQVITQLQPYLKKTAKALDLGCNTGALSLYMASMNSEVIGIDLASNAIATAQKSAEQHNIGNVQFYSMDFIKEWSKQSVFDFVLCNHVIEHVPDDSALLKKIAEALQPEGHLVLMTPTVYSILYRWYKLTGKPFAFDQDVGHLRRYNKEEMLNLISASGLEVSKVVFLDSPLRELCIIPKALRRVQVIFRLPGIRSVINFLDTVLARLFFPATICVHAKRIAD